MVVEKGRRSLSDAPTGRADSRAYSAFALIYNG